MLKVCTKTILCNNNQFIIVARKPVNATAKWINSSDALVTWFPPVINNPLIDGYKVFYGVSDNTFSVGVTKYTELIISGLCSTQNYMFFVVSYSNEEYTLQSEWSDVSTLIAGTLKQSHMLYFLNWFVSFIL